MNWIETAYGLLQLPMSEGEVARRLTEAGCTHDAAEKLVAFLPLACGRVALRDTGIALPDCFRGMTRAGEVGPPQRLADDPDWVEIEAFVAARARENLEPVARVGMKSAEYDAASKALRNGSKPENLVGSEPIFLFIEPDAAMRPRPRPWWAFWRKT